MKLTVLQMSNPSVMEKTRHPKSMHFDFALLEQQQIKEDESVSTDVMVYRQPASDVPVPAAWRPSGTVLDPLDNAKPDGAGHEGHDEEMAGRDRPAKATLASKRSSVIPNLHRPQARRMDRFAPVHLAVGQRRHLHP